MLIEQFSTQKQNRVEKSAPSSVDARLVTRMSKVYMNLRLSWAEIRTESPDTQPIQDINTGNQALRSQDHSPAIMVQA